MQRFLERAAPVVLENPVLDTPRWGRLVALAEEMELSDETRHLVISVPGVTRFVGSGNAPVAMSGQEVERIKGRIEGTADDTAECPYRVGDHVQVTDGPFSDFTGVVDEVNAEREKVKVMVSIFGRATPVELDFLQVKSV